MMKSITVENANDSNNQARENVAKSVVKSLSLGTPIEKARQMPKESGNR